MIVKPRSAAVAHLVSTPVLAAMCAAWLLAAPALAQTRNPPPRDFEAERKAIGDSRAWTNYRFAETERACYSKFLVNRCIEQAKDVQRDELHVLRAKELEVGDAERAWKAAERDREQALRQAEYEAGQPGRAANEAASRASYDRKQQEQALRDAQQGADAPQRAANAEKYNQKQSDFDAKMNEAKQKGADQARQRQENTRAYQQKQADAAQRQKDLDERRANAEEKKKQGQGGSTPSPFGF